MRGESFGRVGLFAGGHLVWSVICSLPMAGLIGTEKSGFWFAGAIAMMCGYHLVGYIAAKSVKWQVPTKRQSIIAVFVPAGIAWLWAGTTALCMYSEISDVAIGVAAVLGLPAFLLASPSLLFVLGFMSGVGRVFSRLEFWWNWPAIVGTAIFLAGLLPPLLFWLGSRTYSILHQAEKSPEAE